MARLRRRYGHARDSISPERSGRTVEEMLESASRPTVPAPRMGVTEYARRMPLRKLLEQGRRERG